MPLVYSLVAPVTGEEGGRQEAGKQGSQAHVSAYALAPCSARLALSLRCKHSFWATGKHEATARRRTHYLSRGVFAPKYRSTMGSLENPSVTLDDGRDCLRQAAASEDEKLLLSPQIYRCAFLG